MKIDIEKIVPNPRQPRKHFDRRELAELAASMKNPAVGQLQPILVEKGSGEYDGYYFLVDGERRWRAAKMIGWIAIDADIREATNHNGRDRLIHAFVANEQRANMNAMERAHAYQAILADLGGNVEKVQEFTGKSSATIYSHLDLLKFEPEVQKLFEHGALIMSPRVVAALKRLDKTRRIIVATRAATRGATEKVFLELCKRQENAKIPLRRQKRLAIVDPVAEGKHFNALNLVPKKFLPENIATIAEQVCRQDCDLYDLASPTSCRECPLVDFLRRV